MTCARRLAGARKPAPSAGSPRRPDPRPGRRRARLSLLLPVLALLLGALSLFATASAQAQISVTLSAEQTTINEGEQVVLKATTTPELTRELARARGIVLPVEIPLTMGGTTTEPGDVRLPATIVLYPGTDNSVHVYAAHDADTDDEEFYVWPAPIPTGFATVSFLKFTITDDDAPPAVTPPDAPTNLVVTPERGALTIGWAAPSQTVTHWRWEWKEIAAPDMAATGADPSTGWMDLTVEYFGGTLQAYISPLKNGRSYNVRVRAENAGGASAWLRGTGTPNVIHRGNAVWLNVQVTPGDRRLTLRWTRTPGHRSSEGPGFYNVQYREKYHCVLEMVTDGTVTRPRYVDNVPVYRCTGRSSDGEGWTSHGSGPDNRGTTRVINGLSPGTEYEVRVQHSSQTANWFYAAGTTTGGTNPRLRALQLNAGN